MQPYPASATLASLGRDQRALTVHDVVGALLADGIISGDDARRMEDYARLSSSHQHALVFLSQRQLRDLRHASHTLTLEDLCRWLAVRCGLEFRRIDPLRLNFARVADVMSVQYATRFRLLPLELHDDEVVIATAEPNITEWIGEIERLQRRRVHRVLADPIELQRYIAEFFGLAKSVRDAQRLGLSPQQANFEQLVELGRSARSLDANDQHVVTIVDWLLQYAYEQRASDIHLEPRREHGVVRFRIDGLLHSVYQIPPTVLAAMTSRLKLLGRMDVVEKRRPQDGRIKTRSAAGQEVELRLSTMPTAFGEKLVLRIFDPQVLLRDFAALGFSPGDVERWQQMTGRTDGIVLVTGPTGSGKTTTLYTTLRQIAGEQVNVCTVEDPIEMVEASFNQMQVQPGIDLGFADGIRALMRQDPDVIMVGEIRDLETAQMAVQASLTGHLVLSTLHTNDAPSAIVRLLDLGVAPYLVSATVAGVMAQRLVRTLCTHCRKPDDEPIPAALWRLLVDPFDIPAPAQRWRPVGCLECRMTGYRGRIGLYELMLLDERMEPLMGSGADVRALRRRAVEAGMVPLRVSGALKVAEGVTTLEEVRRAAPMFDGVDESPS